MNFECHFLDYELYYFKMVVFNLDAGIRKDMRMLQELLIFTTQGVRMKKHPLYLNLIRFAII